MTDEDLKEPVRRREIENEVENLTESWRSVYNLLQRLEAQNAPDPLLEELEELITGYQIIHFRLGRLVQYFPE